MSETETESVLPPKTKPVVTVALYFWTLMPLYIAVAIIAVAYLSVVNGQKARLDKRDQQFCDIARVFLLFEPILPRVAADILDKAITDIEQNDNSECDPKLVLPVLPRATPTASSKPSHHPHPATTQVTPGPTTTVTIVRTPAGLRTSSQPAAPPKKHHKPPKKKPHKKKSKICTIEEALAGKCLLDIPSTVPTTLPTLGAPLAPERGDT